MLLRDFSGRAEAVTSAARALPHDLLFWEQEEVEEEGEGEEDAAGLDLTLFIESGAG